MVSCYKENATEIVGRQMLEDENAFYVAKNVEIQNQIKRQEEELKVAEQEFDTTMNTINNCLRKPNI